MVKITRDDLYHVYYWNPNSQYKIRGKTEPGNEIFISMDGYNMLFLLNWIARTYQVERDTCLEIEKFIKKEIMGTSKSEKKVIELVEKVFLKRPSKYPDRDNGKGN